MRTTKENITTLLKSFLFWLLVSFISFITVTIQLIGSKENGSDGSSFLPITLYEIKLPLFFLGASIFILIFVFIWRSFLFNFLCELKNEHWGFKLAFAGLCILGAFGILAGEVFAMTVEVGMFSSLRPKWTEAVLVLIPCIILILIIIDVIINRKKISSKA